MGRRISGTARLLIFVKLFNLEINIQKIVGVIKDTGHYW